MTEGTDTTTETQAAETPAQVETSNPAITSPDTETVTTADAATSDAEASEAEDAVSDKPRRVSGYDRMKRKNQYLQSEILRLREQVASKPAAEPEQAPREEDFNGDWGKYIAATAAYEAAKAVGGRLDADKKTAQQDRIAELRAEAMADLEERAEAFKAKATDFDDVISKFVNDGGKFTDAVRELVAESDVGPQLAYHIAKHPAIANKLNSLPPLQAAKEIARLEDTLSRSPSRATKAPPPLKSPSGGTAPPQSLTDHAKSDDVSAYVALRRQQRNARA